MKPPRLAALALMVLGGMTTAAFAAYTWTNAYDFSTQGIPGGVFANLGSTITQTNGIGLQTSGNGALYFTSGATDGEIRSALTIAQTGGVFVHYWRSAGGLSGPSPIGTAYVIEFEPTVSGGGACTANLAVYKMISGVMTALSSQLVGCKNGSVLRTVMRSDQIMLVYVDDIAWFIAQDNSITASGSIGVGMRSVPSGNGMRTVWRGPIDAVSPIAPPSTSLAVIGYSDSIDFQWQGAVDDANGIGVMRYDVYRKISGDPGAHSYVTSVTNPTFSDRTVAQNTQYNYVFIPIDWHWNWGAWIQTDARTLATGHIDPRRVGVRSDGAYWGAAGEQIDMLTGNVNFTLPLLKAVGRNGQAVGFSLNYNSQNWRKDAAGTWKIGRDSGYGFGWRLLAGSITPYYRDFWTLSHFVFTDSTGAEYRLDVSDGSNRWTSREPFYGTYDANTNRLYFNDGSFWQMDALSQGGEEDAGTRYPTVFQDSNGNQIKVRYGGGIGSGATADSSSRITQIEDVRALLKSLECQNWCTFRFTYNTDLRLTAIENYIGTSEAYTFQYEDELALSSPFDTTNHGATKLLKYVQRADNNLKHDFYYEANHSGELTRVILPSGGHLVWAHRTFTFASGRMMREVEWRHLLTAPPQGHSWYLWRDPGDSNRQMHWYGAVNQTITQTLGSDRVWFFELNPTTTSSKLQKYVEREMTPNGGGGWNFTEKLTQEFRWNTTGRPYIDRVVNTLDIGTPHRKVSKTEQEVDEYGNLKKQILYDYAVGEPTTPARTYEYAYQADANYVSNYARDRLVTAKVTPVGGAQQTLVTNEYDVTGSCTGSAPITMGLTAVTGARQHTTDASVTVRGLLSRSTAGPVVTCFNHYTTGDVRETYNQTTGAKVKTDNNGVQNFAVPTKITPNKPGTPTQYFDALDTDVTWTSFLALDRQTGPNDAYTQNTYNSYGRRVSARSPHGATTNYLYDDVNRKVKAITNGRWTRTTMDLLGRPTKVETGSGGSSMTDGTVESVVDTEYGPCPCSPLGKVKRVSQPYKPAPEGQTQPPIYWTEYEFDARGRTVKVTHPGNSGFTSYVYEGNAVKVTDPAGKWKRYETDVFGNLIAVMEPKPTPPDQTPQVPPATVLTTYTYNFRNQLLTVTMPRDSGTQTRSFAYDVHGRLESTVLPESGETRYGYEYSTGNQFPGVEEEAPDGYLIVTKTDAKFQTIKTISDTLGRIVQIRRYFAGPNQSTRGAENTAARTTYHYDTLFGDPHQQVNLSARVSAIQYGTSSEPNSPIEYFGYTPGGLISIKGMYWPQDAGDDYLEAQYSYDSEGRLVELRYPDEGMFLLGQGRRRYLNYTYSALGQLTALDMTPYTGQSFGTKDHYAQAGQYNAAGQLSSIELNQMAGDGLLGNANWLTQSRGYNELGQMTRQTVAGHSDIEYRFSPTANDGRITHRKEWITGEEVEYRYDEIGRLTHAITTAASTVSWGQKFVHDGFGNLYRKDAAAGTVPTFNLSVNPATNRITTSGYNYDANGNMIERPGSPNQTFTYDIDNRLTSVNGGGNYQYYANNQRMTDPDTGEIIFYGAGGEELARYRKFSDPLYGIYFEETRASVYAPGGVMWVGQRDNLKLLLTDRLGSVVRNVSTGVSTSYYPYGEPKQEGSAPKFFATYERNSNTGLDYAQQRYYGNTAGRFLTPDPTPGFDGLQSAGRWNRYNYVDADPINRTDPHGLLTILVHGSFDETPDWTDPSSAFFKAIETTFGETPIRFQWRSDLVFPPVYSDIYTGGIQLALRIRAYSFRPNETLNIVAHSHGGNVVKLATWLLSRPIDYLITLGTPQNWDLPAISLNMVRHYCNVSSFVDVIQFSGASPEQVESTVRFAYLGSLAESYAIRSLFVGDLRGFIEYQYYAALYYGASTTWYLTTKLDALADINVLFDYGSHSDLHSVPFWDALKGACRLK